MLSGPPTHAVLLATQPAAMRMVWPCIICKGPTGPTHTICVQCQPPQPSLPLPAPPCPAPTQPAPNLEPTPTTASANDNTGDNGVASFTTAFTPGDLFCEACSQPLPDIAHACPGHAKNKVLYDGRATPAGAGVARPSGIARGGCCWLGGSVEHPCSTLYPNDPGNRKDLIRCQRGGGAMLYNVQWESALCVNSPPTSQLSRRPMEVVAHCPRWGGVM